MKSCFLVLVLLVLPAAAQEQTQRMVFNTGTPEGQMLKAIAQQTDDLAKLTLILDFLAKYPKHENAGWVTEQLQTVYLNQNDYDKALDAGEKALANDPNEVEVAYNNVKAALGKEDLDLVKSWSARTSEIARKILGSAKTPVNDDEKQRLEHVKAVDSYTEYALLVMALKVKDAQKIIDLATTLEQRNPKSAYMSQMSGVYLNALVQSGQAAKACPAAEKLAAANSKDTDALIYAGNCSLQQNRFDRAATLATRAIESVATKPKQEGLGDADWATRRAMLLGRANFIAGIANSSLGKYGLSDKALRIALPSVKYDPQLTAAALFHLGLANYSLGKAIGDKSKIREGLHFFEQSADINGPLQDQAARNVRTIRGELGGR